MRLTAILPCLLAVIFPLDDLLAQEAEPTYEEKRAAIEAHLSSFEYGETFLKELPNTQFVAMDFIDVPLIIKSQMYNALAAALDQNARPQKAGSSSNPGRMEVRIFASQDRKRDDLVEYRWVHMGQNLRVVGSRNAIRLDIDLEEVDRNPELRAFGRTRIQRTIALVEAVLRMRGKPFGVPEQTFELHIPWPDVLSDGARFSTDPEKNIRRIGSIFWFERVDFSVRDQTLSVMCYFRPDRLTGPQDGSKWFPDEFRELVHEKAREQRELSPDTPESEE